MQYFATIPNNMAVRAAYLTSELKSPKSTAIRPGMITALADRYRCPDQFLQFDLAGKLSSDWGYFRFGHDAVCYGRTSSGYRTNDAHSLLYGVFRDVTTKDSTVLLPFDPTEVINNLRLERYARHHGWNGIGYGHFSSETCISKDLNWNQ